MKLREALELIQRPHPVGAGQVRYLLGCSSTSTQLQVFLEAYLRRQLLDFDISVESTIYGDLLSSLERFKPEGYTGVAVVCEWYDLDPRLGFRRLGGWAPSHLPDILASVRAGFSRLQRVLERISAVVPVAVVLPTLPLPPLEICIPAQSSGFDTQLRRLAAEFVAWSGSSAAIRLLSASELDLQSLPRERFDLRAELDRGCAYSLAHASALGDLLSRLLAPVPPLKSLITDLEASWGKMLKRPETFLLSVIYRDKFGPLGKIAVVVGRRLANSAEVHTWVMSCRAFSRRIKHATFRYLFECLKSDCIALEFQATKRNTPFREFLAELRIPESETIVLQADFDARCPQLPHSLEERTVHAWL